MNEVPHPPIVSRDRWLDARKKLLAEEKELTRQYDRVNAERRRLPMVRIEKNYRFEGPGGVLSLKDLFEGRRQLVVYHFMFDPAWEKGCPGCTSYALHRRSRHAPQMRYQFRHGVAGAAEQARGLQRAAGLAFAVGLLVRQRLQL